MATPLHIRRAGEIAIIALSDRIVGGPATDGLQQAIASLLPLQPHIVLNVEKATALDSAGIGVLVRLLHRTRNASGDLKLCCVPPRIAEILRITRLDGIFDVHALEEQAIAAFYTQSLPAGSRTTLGGDILCVEDSIDVLTYICEVLRQAGYRVTPCGNVADAAVLLKVSRPRVIVIGAGAHARLNALRPGASHESGTSVAILELPGTFSSLAPEDSSRELVSRMRALVGEA